MDERKGAVCTLCGKPLGKAWKKLIVREAEERRRSIQLYTQKDWDICEACEERFEDFVERCREAADV